MKRAKRTKPPSLIPSAKELEAAWHRIAHSPQGVRVWLSRHITLDEFRMMFPTNRKGIDDHSAD